MNNKFHNPSYRRLIDLNFLWVLKILDVYLVRLNGFWENEEYDR